MNGHGENEEFALLVSSLEPWLANIERAATELFGEVSDGIREAARMAGARNPSAETVRERCNFGLKQIFG
jgi:hypothetical protein